MESGEETGGEAAVGSTAVTSVRSSSGIVPGSGTVVVSVWVEQSAEIETNDGTVRASVAGSVWVVQSADRTGQEGAGKVIGTVWAEQSLDRVRIGSAWWVRLGV